MNLNDDDIWDLDFVQKDQQSYGENSTLKKIYETIDIVASEPHINNGDLAVPLQIKTKRGDDTNYSSSNRKKRKQEDVVKLSVCEQCRKSKVKCDRGNPCARCVRLKIPCTPTMPSRRGRKRSKTMESCEALVLDSIERSLMKKSVKKKALDSSKAVSKNKTQNDVKNSQDKIGIHFLVRTWLINAFRRRSMFLMWKASKLACQFNISLDEVLGKKDGPMSILPSLMFEKTQDTLKMTDLMGSRLKFEDFNSNHMEKISKYTGEMIKKTDSEEEEEEKVTRDDDVDDNKNDKNQCYIFGRQTNKGFMRYYFSPDFERDFNSDEEQTNFCKRQPCWQSIFGTPIGHDKVMKAIAESYKGCHKINTPTEPKILQIQALTRAGSFVNVEVAISVLVKTSTESEVLFAMKKMIPIKKKRKKKQKSMMSAKEMVKHLNIESTSVPLHSRFEYASMQSSADSKKNGVDEVDFFIA